MTPEDVEAHLRAFKVPPSPPPLKERVLERARDGAGVPPRSHPQSSRWARWPAIAASLFISGAVFWAIVFPPPGTEINPAQNAPSDLYGDPLPSGALQRFGTVRFRHPGKAHHGVSLTALAVSPDGQKLASAAGDGTIRLWDGGSGKELLRWAAHYGEISDVAFSPDGRFLASGGGAQIVATRQLPDGDKTLRIWDAATGKEVRSIVGHDRGITCLAFSPAGKIIVSGSLDRTVRFWDLDSGAELAKLTGHPGAISSISFTRDGSRLSTTGDDHQLLVWNVETRSEVLRIPLRGRKGGFPSADVSQAAFSPDGRFLASVDGNMAGRKVRLWDASSGLEIRSFDGLSQSEMIKAVVFSPDGRTLASRGGAGKMHSWDVDTGKKLVDFTGFELDVFAARFSPDGKSLLAGGDDGAIRRWNVEDGQTSRTSPICQGAISSVAFSPDGRMVATAGLDTAVRLWDAVTGQALMTLPSPGNQNWLKAVAFSPDANQVAALGRGQPILLWDIRSGKETARFSSMADAFAFSPDGKTLAAAGHKGLTLWRIGGEASFPVEGAPPQLLSVAYSSDGKMLAVGSYASSGEGTIAILDASGGKIRSWGAQDSYAYALSSPDGTSLVSAGSGTLRVWDVASGLERARLAGHEGAVVAAAYSPDGKLLASAGRDRTVRLWDLSTATEFRRLEGHEAGVTSVAFSPDGRILASGSMDATALTWEVPRLLRPAVAVPFREADAESLWSDLSSSEPGRAYDATSNLTAGGNQAVAFLKGRLRKPPGDPTRTKQLLAELDDENPTVRAKASDELERIGDEESLRQALDRNPSAEMRIRMEELQAAWRKPLARSPHLLRITRAIGILERIGSAESRSLLEELAGSPLETPKREAAASLERLKVRDR